MYLVCCQLARETACSKPKQSSSHFNPNGHFYKIIPSNWKIMAIQAPQAIRLRNPFRTGKYGDGKGGGMT